MAVDISRNQIKIELHLVPQLMPKNVLKLNVPYFVYCTIVQCLKV